jgi:uncharacterized protein (DUF1697 family)
MKRYIAFLRAVNVGGTTIIKMSDLKRMFESFGLENVETFIQTGNVIFDADESKASVLEQKIERQLADAYGKQIRLFVRTTREVSTMVKSCPFTPHDGETIYVAILEKKPDKKNMDALLAFRSDADDFAIIGKEVFNLRRDRDASVFSNNFVEKILGVAGTTRNLTTMKKLAEKYS